MLNKFLKLLSDCKLINILTNHQIFTVVYMISSMLWFFPILGDTMDIICKICFCWGAFLIFWDLILRHTFLKISFYKLIFCFLVGYIVTIILNFHDGIYMNLKYLFYNGILLLVVFSHDVSTDYKNIRRTIIFLNNIIVFIAFIGSFLSLFLFIFHINFTIKQGNIIFLQGFWYNRLYGIFASPNTGVFLGITSIAVSLINSQLVYGMLFKNKIIYIVNAIIQIIYYSASLSRGGLLTIAVFSLAMCILFLYPKYCKTKGRFVSIILCCSFYLLILGSFLTIVYGTQKVLVYIVNSNYSISIMSSKSKTVSIPVKATRVDGISANKIIDLQSPINIQNRSEKLVQLAVADKKKIELQRIEKNGDVSNGRFDIWKGALYYWKKAPVFGIGNAKIDSNIMIKDTVNKMPEIERRWFLSTNGYMQSLFFQTLICSGLIGILFLFAIIALSGKCFIDFLLKNKLNSSQYRIIGLIFCLIVSYIANDIVESHLMFNGIDPYGVIFWAYLGMGLTLIRKFNDQIHNTDRFAFACDTPYQVFNAINFVSNNLEESLGHSDIYIYHQFKDSKLLSNKLKESGLFNDVFDIQVYGPKKGWYSKFITLIRLLYPRFFLKRYSSDSSNILSSYYSFLVLCSFTSFTMTMHTYFKRANIILLEEGIASYSRNMEDDNKSIIFRVFRALNRRKFGFNPQRIYLNNPKIYNQNEIKLPAFPLPELNKGNKCFTELKHLFNYCENDLYKEVSIIYLTQPTEEVPGNIPEAHAQLLQTLEKFNLTEVLVRVHPRQKNLQIENFCVDKFNNLWELECIQQLSEKNILISAFSTAQIMPKLICDKEPYLIFAYKLFISNSNIEFIRTIEKFIEQFKTLYRKPEKILIPETFLQLEKCLLSLESIK